MVTEGSHAERQVRPAGVRVDAAGGHCGHPSGEVAIPGRQPRPMTSLPAVTHDRIPATRPGFHACPAPEGRYNANDPTGQAPPIRPRPLGFGDRRACRTDRLVHGRASRYDEYPAGSHDKPKRCDRCSPRRKSSAGFKRETIRFRRVSVLSERRPCSIGRVRSSSVACSRSWAP